MIRNLANDFHIASLPLGPIDTNSHILYQNGKAWIIDAPLDSLEAIRKVLRQEQLEPQALLLTHGHYDHMGSAATLRQAFQLPTWASLQDQLLFQNPHIMSAFIMSAFAGNFALQPVVIDHPLDLDFENKRSVTFWLNSWLEVAAYAMPGHTAGGIAFYFPQANCVMTGDQLFRGSVGRSDLPGGNFARLSASIRKSLYSLPKETIVFPGHGEPTTIGHEMQHNPFVPMSITRNITRPCDRFNS